MPDALALLHADHEAVLDLLATMGSTADPEDPGFAPALGEDRKPAPSGGRRRSR